MPLTKPAKYQVIRDALEEMIHGLSAGERIVPVRDLMKNFKASQNTIDRSLRELEAKNLITRRTGSGIYVSRKTARKKTGLVGVVVADITDRACALLVRGVERRLSELGYKMILCNGYEELKRDLDVMRSLSEKIDGAIIYPQTKNIHDKEYVRYFSELSRRKEFPFLLVDIAIPGVGASFIGFDNYKAFLEITRRIFKTPVTGRETRILYVGSFESFFTIDRFNGFKAGLREAGIDERCVETINVSLSSPRLRIPREGLKQRGRLVIFVSSPGILTNLISLLEENNVRIPEEALIVSVVEEDYRDYVHKPIIALVKEYVELGGKAAALLKQMIDGKQIREVTKFDLRIEIPERKIKFKGGKNERR